MKKFISVFLCFILCFNLIPIITFAIDDNPGVFEGLGSESSGDYIISGNIAVTSGDAISLSITLNYNEEQGRITLNGAYESSGEYYFNENEAVHVVIEAKPGFQIEDVVVDDISQGVIENYSFENLADNHVINVTFSAESIGDGSIHLITVLPPVNGSVTADGIVDGLVQVEDGYDITFIVIPDFGYMVSSVIVTQDGYMDDWSFNLNYTGTGAFEFPLMEVRGDMTIEFIFAEADLEMLIESNFVVLKEEAESVSGIKSSLANQFGNYGYVVSENDINISNVDIDEIDNTGYGFFTFSVALGDEQSDERIGYIVDSPSDIIFKLDDGNGNVEIRVVRPSEDPNIDELAVPAMATGTMEVFGYGNLIAAPMSDLEMDGGKIKLPFYRGQFHIMSFMPEANLNLYGFYVIQDDALCVRVSAKSGGSEQKTHQWDFNRYTNLTVGNDISNVFFGNDEFVLAIPPNGIGAAESLVIETGIFAGYTIEDNGDGTYSVNFLSDFYDYVTVNLTINGNIDRQLHIRRIGIDISAYMWDEIAPPNAVFHGTQSGTRIEFTEDNNYKIYGTYCIPDNGDVAPYGLYVVYTWANGSKTTAIITDPCNDPAPMAEDIFSNGVFHYENHVDSCDYLLYSGKNEAQAPVKINVTVLKGDPSMSGSFDGVFFGSGAGVEWTKE